jgi:transcriptional regulator with XRE-family HTH domain
MKAETIAQLVTRARRAEGLTQEELARRMGTTQSAIARLEAGQSNPTVATVEKALRACGHTLQPQAKMFRDSVDESLIRASLRMTPAQRLRSHQSARKNTINLVRTAHPVPSGS